MLPMASVAPNPHQPRQQFDEKALAQLSESIRTNGLMQPIVVRPRSDGMFEIVAGERRWRAAFGLNMIEIPAVIHELDDRTVSEWSLIENLQREDLNPMERAEAFQRLIDDHGLTHQSVADRLGLERSWVSNHLRLLELNQFCQEWVREGELSMGHAKVLLAVANTSARTKLARAAIKEGLSVRELEKRVRQHIEGGPLTNKVKSPESPEMHPHVARLQKDLAELLGTKVQVVAGKKKGTGKLVVDFYSFEQFEGLLEQFGYEVRD
ncbi:MAG: ParB/RepB/Spo0J family partition protein [Planctomycetota bacterium]